jgi:Predicted periplasmic protein (DUF2092)
MNHDCDWRPYSDVRNIGRGGCVLRVAARPQALSVFSNIRFIGFRIEICSHRFPGASNRAWRIDGDLGSEDGPQYTVQLRNWKTGSEVVTPDFAFKPPSSAKQISIDELKKMKDMGELPSHFILGGK